MYILQNFNDLRFSNIIVRQQDERRETRDESFFRILRYKIPREKANELSKGVRIPLALATAQPAPHADKLRPSAFTVRFAARLSPCLPLPPRLVGHPLTPPKTITLLRLSAVSHILPKTPTPLPFAVLPLYFFLLEFSSIEFFPFSHHI